MTAPPMSATSASAAVAARCGAAAQVQRAVAAVPDPAANAEGADNHVFKEPVMKEKLKYLRYFRLVTHRKKNGKFIPCSYTVPTTQANLCWVDLNLSLSTQLCWGQKEFGRIGGLAV